MGFATLSPLAARYKIQSSSVAISYSLRFSAAVKRRMAFWPPISHVKTTFADFCKKQISPVRFQESCNTLNCSVLNCIRLKVCIEGAGIQAIRKKVSCFSRGTLLGFRLQQNPQNIGVMKKSDLQFDFPEDLIAKEPLRPSRICSGLGIEGSELDWPEFLAMFNPNDVLVLNDTKVLKRRVFTDSGLEVLFLSSEDQIHWQVLFPSRKFKVGQAIALPGELSMILLEKGRPQKVQTSQALEEAYFEQHGELPLPPYIQKVRENRHAQGMDSSWYQTAWNEKPGSFAAPTASLHFKQEHLEFLKKKGVQICYLTLHVGLGTFLPVEVDDLATHPMHEEEVEIPHSTLKAIGQAKQTGGRVWAMGTTVARALESHALGKFQAGAVGFRGKTNLLILPGFEFKMVDVLLTNFHQPESTLLALVMAFAGIEKVKSIYRWALENKFRLFSYGDLSIWTRA